MQIDEWYFDWLISKAGVDDDPSGYSHLCWILFDTPFLPILEMDENRWEIGLQYRDEFAKLFDKDDYLYEDDYGCDGFGGVLDVYGELHDLIGGCTMLELILSLAERMKFEMLESEFEAGTGKWFMELLDNLGLHNYTNSCIIMHDYAYDEIQEILERLNLRKYRANGSGGLFPLQTWRQDQRGLELITQMNNYLADRYDIL